MLDPILDEVIAELGIDCGPVTSENVIARYIDSKHILYLKIGKEPKQVELNGRARSILHDKDYVDGFRLEPFEPEFLEIQ